MSNYTQEKIESELLFLDKWQYVAHAIEKKFVFLNFPQALGFIVQVGLLAEKQQHHPELFNVHNKVTLRLNTHDSGGVTQKDFDLAHAIDGIFSI